MPDFARISLVEASPHRPGTAYVAANHYQFDDFAPYVWRTDDYGQTWTKIVAGIAPNHYARAIREDTVREKLLYLGTEHGIYVSFDDGAHWQSLNQNLPDTPVHDIKVEARDLVIATHGRGFYVMDNISPLRQWVDETSQPLHLFKPQDPLRGLDQSLAIDYSLKAPAQSVTIDVLDSQGNVIRSFTSAAPNAAAAPQSPADAFRPRDPMPPVSAGMHRLNWDLRYKGATEIPGLIMWAASTRGPVAPPGSYEVRVTADGATERQSFAIRREPHVLADVTDADLQKEFDLAMQISTKTSQANEAVMVVRGIRPQIDDRRNKLDSKTGPTAQALDKLENELTTVETTLYQVKNQSSEDPLNYPIKLNNKVAAIQGIVESADSAPTSQSVDVFMMLAGQVDQQLKALDNAVTVELPRVNEMLQRQRVDPITPPKKKTEDRRQ